MAGEYIKCVVEVNRIFYPKNEVNDGDWAAFLCNVVSIDEDSSLFESSIKCTGIVPALSYSEKYHLIAKQTENERYGIGYEVIRMNKYVDLENEIDQRAFLDQILTEKQVNSLYENLENPFICISNGDVKTLTKTKGIGEQTACKIIEKYKDNLDNALAYITLSEYGLTQNMIDKLIEIYHSADIVIRKVTENPYILIEEVDGIGWKKADAIALNKGMEEDSVERISAYIYQHLMDLADEGDTWTTPEELVSSIIDELGVQNQDKIRTALYCMNEKGTLVWNSDKSKIFLDRLYQLEKCIAHHLKRILNSQTHKDKAKESKFKELRSIEIKQGWDYTEEQIAAIKMILDQQVCIVTGSAGTGKSSVVSGALRLLDVENFAQTALSGRAAARLSEITNQDGHTIHRLLGFNPAHGFEHNEENPLPYEVVILDEVSMVGADLFLNLIKSIDNGTKFIMLGDEGQLESIGLCNIFKDMLDSGVVPAMRLTKIHRQASKSAIITESLKVRTHEQLTTNGWVGEEIRGELQDFQMDIYNDMILSNSHIMRQYEKMLERYQSHDIQIVVPMKAKGEISTHVLNNQVQELVNPFPKKSIEINKQIGKQQISYRLGIGDKVIVVQNDYKTKNCDGKTIPIFNGNQGVVKNIDNTKEHLVVAFQQWGDIVIPKSKTKLIELGYALSCHKLQGSESPCVIIGLDFSARVLLTKEWLYTAITRAKNHCVLCAEAKALNYCITNSNVPYKRTMLKEMLMKDE